MEDKFESKEEFAYGSSLFLNYIHSELDLFDSFKDLDQALLEPFLDNRFILNYFDTNGSKTVLIDRKLSMTGYSGIIYNYFDNRMYATVIDSLDLAEIIDCLAPGEHINTLMEDAEKALPGIVPKYQEIINSRLTDKEVPKFVDTQLFGYGAYP